MAGGKKASVLDPAPRRRFKLSGKVFKLIEKHLKDADELATKTVMPSQGAASSVNQNTEQRWLCRMVSNASKELKQRVEVDKEIGAAEEEAEDARTSLQAARNEALAKIAALKEEKAELERRVEAVKGRVVEAQRKQCRQEERERRPTVSMGGGADGSASAEEELQPCPPKVELDSRQFTVLRTQSKRMGDLLGELSVAMPKRLKSFKDTAHTVMQWLEEEPSELEKVMQKEMPRFNTSTAAGSSSQQQQQSAGPPPKAPTTSNGSKASSAPMPPPSSAGSMSRCFTPAGLLAHHIMKQQQLR